MRRQLEIKHVGHMYMSDQHVQPVTRVGLSSLREMMDIQRGRSKWARVPTPSFCRFYGRVTGRGMGWGWGKGKCRGRGMGPG